MNHPAFITKHNIATLWDVICDHPLFQQLSNAHKDQMRRVFYDNFSGFYEREKTQEGQSLVALNKKYILAILQHMKQLQVSATAPRKIKIHDESFEPLTIEEIQNKKLSEFEHGIEAQRKDLDSYLVPPRPSLPHFADPTEDTSLDIEEALRQITAQRNYEGQKQPPHPNVKDMTHDTDVNTEDKKKVTWGENTDIYTTKELHQKISQLESQLQELQSQVVRLLPLLEGRI